MRAVLFDMDGTLVDSEKVWDVGLDELAGYYGAVLSPSARASMVGTSMIESMEILHDDIAQPWRDPASSTTWLEARVRELFAAGLIWRPGAQELLSEVRAAGVPTALVTATNRHLVEVAFQTIGSTNFDAVICGDDLPHTKPRPEPYLAAAAALGVPIAECVAIEDSPNGIRSALAAGAVVVAVPCEVDLSTLDGVVHVPSLVHVNLAYLRTLVR